MFRLENRSELMWNCHENADRYWLTQLTFYTVLSSDSTPLARHRIRELKGMKKTFFKELEMDAKKGNETVGRSLRYVWSYWIFRYNSSQRWSFNCSDFMRHWWRQTELERINPKKVNLTVRKKHKKCVPKNRLLCKRIDVCVLWVNESNFSWL